MHPNSKFLSLADSHISELRWDLWTVDMKSHWRLAETNRKVVTVRSECITVAYAIMI